MPDQSPNERRWTIYECQKCGASETAPGGWTCGCGSASDGLRTGRLVPIEVMPVPSSQEPDDEGIYPDCSPRCDVRGGAIHAADCPHAGPPSTQPVEDELCVVCGDRREAHTSPAKNHDFLLKYKGGLEERVARVLARGACDGDDADWRIWLKDAREVLAVLADGAGDD